MSVKKPPPTWENFCRELIFILYSRLLVKKKAAKECLDAPAREYEVAKLTHSSCPSLFHCLGREEPVPSK